MADMLWILLLQTESQSQPASQSFLKSMLFLALIVAAALLMLIGTSRRIKRSRKHDSLSVKERIDMKTGHKDMYNAMGELMAELAELSRQINGQIDTRCTKLEILLKHADEKIEQLQNLQQHQNPADRKKAHNNGPDGSKTRSPKTASPNLTGKPLNNNASQTTGLTIPSDGIDDSPDTRQVLDLAKKGMDDIAIAKVLDRPVGEIQLILSLTKKKH